MREKDRSLSPLGRTIKERLLKFNADPSALLGSMKSISRAKAKKAKEDNEKKQKKRKKRTRSFNRLCKIETWESVSVILI